MCATVRPSLNACALTSRPASRSSTTTLRPASPSAPSTMSSPQRIDRRSVRVRDDGALAGSQPVGLHDDVARRATRRTRAPHRSRRTARETLIGTP